MLAFLVIALIAGSTNFAVIGNALSDNTWQYPIATVIAIAAAFFAVFIEMGKIPFDLAEAEQELQEGPLTEYSGPALALLKVGLSLKSMVVASIFVSVLLPFGIPTEMSLSAVILGGILFFVKLFVVFVLACVFENTLSRTRFMLTGRFNRDRLRHFLCWRLYFTSLGCKEDKYGTFSSDYNHFTFRRSVYCRFEQKNILLKLPQYLLRLLRWEPC